MVEISPKTGRPKKRPRGIPFEPGVSPNPGGRRKDGSPRSPRGPRIDPTLLTRFEPATAEELAQSLARAAPAALALLTSVMHDEACEVRDRVVAARALLDKVQPNAVAVKDPEAGAGGEALREFVEAIKATPSQGEGEA